LTEVVDWKYELVKHDFSTFDLLGQWGFQMGAAPTIPGWSFNDRSRTNAEIHSRLLQGAARSRWARRRFCLGCNTVSHLAAGVFEMQRTGDDTSGKVWERTRRMGVNTLAYRLPQDGIFLRGGCGLRRHHEGDLRGSLNRQWMDLLARSGTGPVHLAGARMQLGQNSARRLQRRLCDCCRRSVKGLCTRCSIKEFVLEIWKGQRYKMPSCLFSCQHLIHLELFNCLLKPPLTFKGFKSLKSLDLQHVTLAQDVFENLISSCPLLERLTLMNFDGFTHLNIDAPNLQFFDIGGVFNDISFENTFHLAVVSIGLYDKKQAHAYSSNLLKFFAHLPHIRRLEVQSYFLKVIFLLV
jgi:hypothetical protein